MNIVPMTVPDTLEGAVILSIVDFFLSIVLIYGISFILMLFPYLNKLGSISDESLKGGH
ncbi:MAG: hypothetical protein P4N59_15525 [Negativicutes bacterium]|nr:hypothetical protein [Negativicutes bacterium]